MFKFSRDVEYALISLVEMSKLPPEELITAKEISTCYSIPFKLLARILQVLSNDGLIAARKGRGGGYKLMQKPADISLGRVIKAVRGQEPIAECHSSKKHCAQSDCGCNIKPIIDIYQEKWVSFVEKTTLDECLQSNLNPDT